MTDADKAAQADNGTDEPVTETGSSTEDKQQPSPRQNPAAWLSIAALLVAVIAMAGAGWLWWQFEQAREQLASQTRQVSQTREQLQGNIDNLQRSVTGIAPEVQTELQDYQQQINTELARMRSDMNEAQGPDWLLAEAEYLIRVANHRLQLQQDPDTAMVALQMADERLRTLDSPALVEVRRRLADDMAALKAMPRLDVEGLSLTLASLQRRVEQLPINVPLGREAQVAEQDKQDKTETSWWRTFLGDVWHTLSTLVTIRRLDDTTEAVAVPEQRAYLRQNLALKLEAARYAVLRRDDNAYHDNLAIVRDWLQRYFDKQASEVVAMLETVNRLDKQKLDRPLPSVTASLQAIEQLKKARSSATAGVKPGTPASQAQ